MWVSAELYDEFPFHSGTGLQLQHCNWASVAALEDLKPGEQRRGVSAYSPWAVIRFYP